MATSRVLVAGATGQLGSAIVRKLVSAGVPVRALARHREKLAAFETTAEIAPVDLLDVPKLTEACRGIDQIVATANNNMGKGPTSPTRIDLAGYQNLCAAARNTGVRRLIYVSYRGVTQDVNVDIFRVKWYIEDAIRRSGVPYVMLRPAAFMDIWIDQVIAKNVRDTRVATIFGSGNVVANYVAVDDVAQFAVKIAAGNIMNGVVEAGGPSNVTQNDIAAVLERRLQTRLKRRHVPILAMRLAPIVRPFNEVAARMMTIGLFSATQPMAFPGWKESADRLGVSPRSIEDYVDELFRRG
jgi:uncharacterized protein YbjT (DUF2867 family)